MYILQQMQSEHNNRSQTEPNSEMQQQNNNVLWGEYGQEQAISKIVQDCSSMRQNIEQKVHMNCRPANNMIRNRRYAKLKMLWKQGFFDEEQIMVRFPKLYFEYVGKYKKQGQANKFETISQFLQSQAMRNQYRQMLNSEISQKPCSQMTQQSIKQSSPFQQQLQSIPKQSLQLQEQSLIDFIELKFLEGQLQGFNYQQIDNDEGLDSQAENKKQKDQDQQYQYFQQGLEEDQRDPSTNTGIQDF